MIKFFYNNTKNKNIGFIFFKLNYCYYFWMLYKTNNNFHYLFKTADKLLVNLEELIIICKKNLNYVEKYVNNKSVKPKNYDYNKKIWLNNKYIKIKQNWKLDTQFFETF